MKKVVDLGLHEQIAIFAGVGPTKSQKVAEYMKTEVAGMDVPDWVLKRMDGLSKEDQQKAGIDICLEIARQVMEIEGVKGLARDGSQLAGGRPADREGTGAISPAGD